jgi:hypothetical protein
MRRTAGIDVRCDHPPPRPRHVRTLQNRAHCRSISCGAMADPSEARLAEVVAVLSMATDLGTGQPIERGIRTARGLRRSPRRD